MPRKPKFEIKYKCKSCGYIPEPNKEKSNENWNVIDTKCSKCGGFVGMYFDEK